MGSGSSMLHHNVSAIAQNKQTNRADLFLVADNVHIV